MKRDWVYLGIILIAIGILAGIFGRAHDPNEAYLKSLSPMIRIKFRNFLNGIRKLGYTPVIRDATRSASDQKKHYAKDHRNAKPGHSHHEAGLAIDMDLHKGPVVFTKNTVAKRWILTGVPALARQHGIQWGGNFKGYADNNHFYYS